jgi:GNAT superfamily N-acetyltransferase
MGDIPAIRLATSADRTAIETIVREAYGIYIARMGKEPGPMLGDYGALIGKRRVHVLDVDSKVLGLVVLIPEADVMLLDNVAVASEAQGKGYGRRLIEFAEDEARRQGFRFIRLYTNALMSENLSLYSRLGYVETHRGEEKGFARVYLRKSLAGPEPEKRSI